MGPLKLLKKALFHYIYSLQPGVALSLPPGNIRNPLGIKGINKSYRAAVGFFRNLIISTAKDFGGITYLIEECKTLIVKFVVDILMFRNYKLLKNMQKHSGVP